MAESMDATVKENLRRELGLDRPLHLQYAAWMGRLLRGDLGRSIRNGEPVIENVGRRLRPSLELTFFAMTISLVVAFPSASCPPSAATPRSTAPARRSRCSDCMPNFLAALLLIFLFGVTLRWLPISGYTDPFEEPWNGFRSLALPAITLGLALAAVVTRTFALEPARGARRGLRAHRARQGPLGVADHLEPRAEERADPRGHGTRAAARHLDRRRRHHRVRHSRCPRSGASSSMPVFARDYPLVQGVVLLIAIGFILSNLIVDVLYGWIDPRIRSR